MERKINILLICLLNTLFTIINICAIYTSNVSGQGAEESGQVIHEAVDETEKNDEETGLDLELIINEAISRNPEIQAAAQRWEAAKDVIRMEKSLDEPMLTLGVMNAPGHPFNIGADAMKVMPIMSPQRIGISQKFPFPGKLRLRGKVAAEGAEIEEEAMKAKIQEIIAGIKDAYYTLYLINKSIEISEENRELLQKFTKIAEAMYSVGKASQRDVLAAMVELSKIVNDIIVLEQKKMAEQARLNNLLNRNPNVPLGTPKDFNKHTLTFKLNELEKMALEKRPALQQSEHAVEKNRLNLELVKKDYYSDITAMIEYDRLGAGNFPSDTWSSELSINIPWLWSKQRQKVKEARRELQAANADHEAASNLAQFEIRNILSKIISADSTLNLFKTSVIPQAEQSLDAARIGYETAGVDFLTLIDSQRTLLDAKLQYYTALVEYEQNLAKLEMTVGTGLTAQVKPSDNLTN